jgi:hypothetical protein
VKLVSKPEVAIVAAEDLVPRPPSLDRFRSALKFSLWTWALYWPGGGLLLLMGGLDFISVLVTFASLATFIGLMATGALRADSSHTLKEFMLERPLYLVAGLIVLIVMATILPSVEGFALLLFSAAWFGGLAVASARLVEHVRGQGLSIWGSRADQLLIVFGISGFFSSLVFLDALLPIIANGATLGSPSMLVAVSTWANLLYPAMVMVASRPFRDPLRWPSRKEPEAPVAAAPRRRKAKEPLPFRAS